IIGRVDESCKTTRIGRDVPVVTDSVASEHEARRQERSIFEVRWASAGEELGAAKRAAVDQPSEGACRDHGAVGDYDAIRSLARIGEQTRAPGIPLPIHGVGADTVAIVVFQAGDYAPTVIRKTHAPS